MFVKNKSNYLYLFRVYLEFNLKKTRTEKFKIVHVKSHVYLV